MRTKNLLILVVVAAVLCGLAYLSKSKQNQRTASSDHIGKPVLAALQDTEKLNSVEQLTVQTAQSTITVARVDGVWVAPGRYNYPVDFEKIRGFIRKLAELKVGQPASGSLESLSLTPPAAGADPAQAAHMGTQVTLRDKAGTVVASLLVGKERKRKPSADGEGGGFGGGFDGYPDGRYVAAGKAAYLVTEAFGDLPADDKALLAQDLVNISGADLAEISVNAAGTNLVFRRASEGAELVLDAKLAADEEAEPSKASSLANTLSYLNFTDVVDPALPDSTLGLDKPTVFTAKSKKGQVFTLKLGGKAANSEDRHVRLAATYTPPPEPAAPTAPEVAPDPSDTNAVAKASADAARKEDEARKRKEEQEKLAKETSELNDRLAKWTYVVASYKVENVKADRAFFIKKKEPPKTEDKPSAPPAKEADTAAKSDPPSAPVQPAAAPVATPPAKPAEGAAQDK